jgi:two-component system, OmpR family, sensor histidine kinase CpxA
MRTLFFKIFISFWSVVAIFIVIAVLLLGRRAPPPQTYRQTVDNNAFAMYSQSLAQTYDAGGKAEFYHYLQQFKRNSQGEAYLLDGAGNEVAGQTLPSQTKELATRAQLEGKVESAVVEGKEFFAQQVVTIKGASYVAVVGFPYTVDDFSAPPGPQRLLRDLGIAIVISGIVCFWLARYLSAPIVRLRNAAQELSKGNLAARAKTNNLDHRRDEIAELVQDFDQMAEQIESLMHAQKRLISDVSHEFRSPLTRINLAVELVRSVDSPEVSTAITRIERETERLNGMVGKLLTLSRMEAGPQLMDKEEIELSNLLRQVVDDADFEARNRNCRVVLYETDECHAVGSPELLHSAVENIVRNAVRYTADQTEVEVRLHCKANDADFEAVVKIRDHGPGVPESSLQQLFRPFFRLDESRERKTGGTGLGLAIAQRAVRLHGGDVRASNAPGGGLEVTITFPAASFAAPKIHTS